MPFTPLSNSVFFAIVLGITWSAFGQSETKLLTLGSDVPDFVACQFVQGDPVNQISEGTVHVLEFSGTQCKPCIKAIPLMESLQDQHKDVVFMAVFSEPEEGVKEFLKGLGIQMTGRVISDKDGAIRDAWSTAAGQRGIPHVFVVDKKSKIAWIGHPNELESHLSAIVAGTHLYTTDPIVRMRQEINNQVILKRRKIEHRRAAASELNNVQVSRLIREEEYENALKLLNEGITTYHDLPIVGAMRARKLLVFGRLEGKRTEAYSLAREIIVDARLAQGISKIEACTYLLNHYKHAFEQNLDRRMLTMVFAYLAEFDPARLVSDDAVSYHRMAARTHKLAGDREKAIKSIGTAIDLQAAQLKRLEEAGSVLDQVSYATKRLEYLRKESVQIKNDAVH